MNMRAAAIDIGTNSCRLLIAESEANKNFNILKRKLEVTRLGEGVEQSHSLKPEAIKRVSNTLNRYKEIIEDYQVKKIRIVGTSALRDADNSDLMREIIKNMGFKLEIISGEQEAELNYLGAASNLDKKFLLIDIGGGSTEFIWPWISKLEYKSLDLGCVRLTEKFINAPKNTIKDFELNKMESYILKNLKNEFKFNKDYSVKGVGGTITTAAAIKLNLKEYDSNKIENTTITLEELKQIIERLSALKIRERKKVNGLQPKRADIIITGLIILKEILIYIGQKGLTVSDQDLLYALIKKQLSS